jgi:hypothetical protein
VRTTGQISIHPNWAFSQWCLSRLVFKSRRAHLTIPPISENRTWAQTFFHVLPFSHYLSSKLPMKTKKRLV